MSATFNITRQLTVTINLGLWKSGIGVSWCLKRKYCSIHINLLFIHISYLNHGK